MDAKTTALFGGSKLEVQFQDGTSAEVKIKQLPIRKMEAFLEAQKSEPAIIELCTDLKPEQVDALTNDSHEALLAEVEKVNSDFFSRWLDRLKARAKKLDAIKNPSPSPTGLPSAASEQA